MPLSGNGYVGTPQLAPKLQTFRTDMGLSLGWTAAAAFLVINAMLLSASLLVYAERRVSAFIQNRPGPNRVGPLGILQPFADVLKFVLKGTFSPHSRTSLSMRWRRCSWWSSP